VGVVGYLLGGGLSCYGRMTGLAANAVRAIELVTADGQCHRADHAGDPELLWALRGGGGGFGVVTAVEIDLFPADRVITGALFWSAVHAPRLMEVWRRWTVDAPREVTTSLRVMNLPDVPEVPEVLRIGTVIGIDGTVLCADGDTSDAWAQAHALLEPLRAVADPVMDTWEETAASAVLATHMDPTEPVPVLGDHMLLGELDEVAIRRMLDLVGTGSGSPLVLAGLRQLGGAFAVPDPTGGALDHFDARFVYSAAGVPETPAVAESIADRCAAVRTALGPWDTGRTAPTFVATAEQPQGHLSDDQVRRLDAVRARVDPDGLFRSGIAPGATFSCR
jgi:FAD/FMN-containing dehydrogenase